MKVVYPEHNRCINCGLCEVACIVAHSKSKGPISSHLEEDLQFNWESSENHADPETARLANRSIPLSRCRAWKNDTTFISTMCRHCQVAECVLACKNGALYKDNSGRVLVNEDKCVGCWMCVMACRFGAITRNVNKKNVPEVKSNGINHHCDLCPDRDIPACVEVCPTRALVYAERELSEEIQQ